MRGHIERRISLITGKVTYRPVVRVTAAEARQLPELAGRHRGPTCRRLRPDPHGVEPSAEEALEELRDDLRRRLRGEPDRSLGSVADLLARWMRDAVALDKRDNTRRAHEFAVRLHIVPALGSLPAADLTAGEVAAWQAAEIAAGAAPKSVRNYRGTLHACYAWARSLGLVSANPVSSVRPPRLPETRPVPPTMEDALSYLAALRDTRLWPALMLAAFTGARRGEVLAVRWEDVDLATGELRITRSIGGRNRATMQVGPTKTAKGRRTVTLPPVALAELSRLQAERRLLLSRESVRSAGADERSVRRHSRRVRSVVAPDWPRESPDGCGAAGARCCQHGPQPQARASAPAGREARPLLSRPRPSAALSLAGVRR